MNRRGSILVISFWILGILSVLATGIAFSLSLEMRLSRYAMDRVTAEHIAKAGIVQTIERISADKDDSYDSLIECGIHLKPKEKPEDLFKEVSFGDGVFNIRYEEQGKFIYGPSDEDRKININLADAKVLTALLKHLAALDEPKAQELASNIIDWRDEDHTSDQQNGSEGAYYQGLSHRYAWKNKEDSSVRNKEFRTPEELLLVKDMTPKIFDKIKNFITLYGKETPIKVNVNTAPKEVLEVMALVVGVSEFGAGEVAQKIIQVRNSKIITQADLSQNSFFDGIGVGSFAENLRNFFKCKSSYYRIDCDASIEGSNIHKILTVIIGKVSGEKPLFVYFHDR